MGEFYTLDEDTEILLHREAHFSGHFPLMLEYYEGKGVGKNPDISLQRIQALMQWEEATGQNLAELLLSESDVERIKKAKAAYLRLRELFRNRSSKGVAGRWFARLIFAEKMPPLRELAAVVHFYPMLKGVIKELLLSPEYYDPLFPGYGKAPLRLLRVLFHVKDPEWIPSLFNLLSDEDFEWDAALMRVLRQMVESKEWLLKVLTSQPITRDNEWAAMVLSSFAEDLQIKETADAFLRQLPPGKYQRLIDYLSLLV